MHDTVCALSQAVRPENVVVEVCRSRTAILYDQEPQGDGSTHAPQSNSMSLTCAVLFSLDLALHFNLVSRRINASYPLALRATAQLCSLAAQLFLDDREHAQKSPA